MVGTARRRGRRFDEAHARVMNNLTAVKRYNALDHGTKNIYFNISTIRPERLTGKTSAHIGTHIHIISYYTLEAFKPLRLENLEPRTLNRSFERQHYLEEAAELMSEAPAAASLSRRGLLRLTPPLASPTERPPTRTHFGKRQPNRFRPRAA